MPGSIQHSVTWPLPTHDINSDRVADFFKSCLIDNNRFITFLFKKCHLETVEEVDVEKNTKFLTLERVHQPGCHYKLMLKRNFKQKSRHYVKKLWITNLRWISPRGFYYKKASTISHLPFRKLLKEIEYLEP